MTIYETTTGDIIRQIPDEEMLEILRRLATQNSNSRILMRWRSRIVLLRWFNEFGPMGISSGMDINSADWQNCGFGACTKAATNRQWKRARIDTNVVPAGETQRISRFDEKPDDKLSSEKAFRCTYSGKYWWKRLFLQPQLLGDRWQICHRCVATYLES